MEIKINLEVSLSPALVAFLTDLASGPVKSVPAVEVVKEEKPAKEKPAKAEKPAQVKDDKPKIGLTDIRQWAIKSAENKAKMRAQLTAYGVEGDNPKLDQLPADQYEKFYTELTEEL